MNFIAFLRSSLNCTLADFGLFLDISLSSIRRAETESSMLPLKCIQTLGVIQSCIQEADKLTNPKELRATAFELIDIEEIRLRNDAIRLMIPRLQIDMSIMASEYNSSGKAQIYLNQILSNSVNMSANQIFWLKSQISKQKSIMDKNGPAAQHQMQIKMAKLETEWQLNLLVLEQNPLV
jgi:hypothetical protein